MNDPLVRLAVADDAARLRALQRRLDEQTSFMLLEPGERDGLPEPLAAAGLGYHLVADPGVDLPLAGYVHVDVPPYRRARRTGYLVIGVDAATTGRGVGSRLMRAAVQEGRRRGLRRIELTVMTHNLAAIRLYLSCGFQAEGLRRGCLEVDGRPVDEYYFGILLPP
jgi:ribosomal protein S18 acetylase RimI-like enzyme